MKRENLISRHELPNPLLIKLATQGVSKHSESHQLKRRRELASLRGMCAVEGKSFSPKAKKR